jgi:hypothetical protein
VRAVGLHNDGMALRSELCDMDDGVMPHGKIHQSLFAPWDSRLASSVDYIAVMAIP